MNAYTQNKGFSNWTKFWIVFAVFGLFALFFTELFLHASTKVGLTLVSPRLDGSDSGLVGHWTFDGKDMVSNVADISGQGNVGYFVGGLATTTVAGALGQGLQFVDSISKYVDIPTTNGLDFGGSSFSIFGWVNMPSSAWSGSAYRTIFSKASTIQYGNTNTNGFGLLTSNNGALTFVLPGVDPTSFVSSGGACSNVVNTGKWCFIGANYDAANHTVTYYSNGVAFSTKTTAAVSTATNSRDANISGAGRPFPGAIDDVRVYGRVLSDDEVAELYQMGGSAKQDITTTAPRLDDLNSGLIAHWTFDGKDTVGGEVIDTSGSGNDGSMMNMPTSTAYTGGILGQAFNFNQSNDFVRIPTMNISGDIAVSAWVNTPDWSQKGFIIGKNSVNTQWELFLEVGFVRWRGGGVTSVSKSVASLGLQPNTWHHFVGEQTGTTGTLFVDGVEVATGTVPVIGNGSGTVEIGSFGGGTSYNFKGTIDDVRVYDRTLSPDEVAQLYQQGAATKVAAPSQAPRLDNINSGLVAHYTFDGKDMIGGEVDDTSGNGKNGSIIKTATSTAYTSGIIGQALYFDGLNDSVNNGVLVPSLSGSITNVMSVSVWIDPDAAVPNDSYAAVLRQNDTTTNGMYLRYNNTDPNMNFGVGNGTHIAVATTADLPANQWTHIVGVYDGSKVYVYTNDVLTDSADASLIGTIDFGTATALGIGVTDLLTADFFKGKIDDVRIYNRVLSPDEIKQLYQMGQ
jgi:hypothetical protein